MKQSYIYMVTNSIDGRRYVGQHDGSKGHYYGSGSYFNRAVSKYGKKAFTREILCKGNFDAELLDLLEQEAIEKYQTYIHDFPESGYNLTKGGSSGQHGLKHRSSSKQLVADNNPRRKPVYQFSKAGDLIATFKSSKEAERMTGIPRSSIYRCSLNSRKTAGGFIWSFSNQPAPYDSPTTIHCYTTEGKYLKSYGSMVEAGLDFGSRHTAISNAVKSGGKAYGHYWSREKI